MDNKSELLNFFNIQDRELGSIIGNALNFSEGIEHPAMKKNFESDSNSILASLAEIKNLLEKRKSQNEIEAWLSTPLNDFKGMSPKEAILNGRTLPVLMFLSAIEERIRN